MTVKQYRKKPVVIEAMQITADAINEGRLFDWSEGVVQFGAMTTNGVGEVVHAYVNVTTLEGTMRGYLGDFVIKGVQGEFYPCKPDIFEATYEEAELPPAAAKVFIRPAKLSGWKWECVCWTSGVERTWRGALRVANSHLKGHDQ